MDAINVRVVAFLKHTGKSKSEFANQLDISPAVISHISSGRNKVALDIVQKILEHYPTVSPHWLLMGVGDMIEDGNSVNGLALKQEIKSLKIELSELSNRVTVFQRNFKKLSDLVSD
jgi:plasmid maintenance system antidote protein VapI